MSYIRLNISDQTQTINGEVHASVGDSIVAALSAEPETIDELTLALARFIAPQDDSSPFRWFAEGQNFEPYDAGILIIDLAARVVVVDSSYSQPSANGQLAYHDGTQLTDVPLLYRLSEDWLFVYSIPEYEGVSKHGREERERLKPIDARAVLYGAALIEFIVRESLAALDENSISTGLCPTGKNEAAIIEANEEAISEAFEKIVSDIHAKWLMTPREDLQGKTPREILLAKKDFIDFDLHSREVHWSFTGLCPPPLPTNSNAYTRAGFGTHEIVVYYHLVRYVLKECFDHLQTQNASTNATIEFLEQQKAFWLETPNRDYSGIIPSRFIELERRRIPFVVSRQEAIIDEDCSVCQTMAEDFETPMFRHLDGSSMDDRFEFSYYQTRQEWEDEQIRWQEFNREFEREWQERKEKSLQNEPPIWLDDDEGLIQ
jgi:hypothetical protein